MALQDLTPQLRTRLSRMEKAVGWFMFVATALLLFGLGYYIYKTAENKGWFLKKVEYSTSIGSGDGLKEGQPVKLMGFEVGEVTKIEANSPEEYYNVTVYFRIKPKYAGYVLTDSVAKIASGSLLVGGRYLEITKGTIGVPTVLKNADDTPKAVLNQKFFKQRKTEFEKRYPNEYEMYSELNKDAKSRLKEYYTNLGKDTIYWVPPEEEQALTERAQQLLSKVEAALPGILALTNQLTAVLNHSAAMTSNLNEVAEAAKPLASNLAIITSNLHDKGSLGEWLIPTNINAELGTTLHAANTNLVALAESLQKSLDNLASITSNLNNQVQVNTNILSNLSDAVVHSDQLIQGLKHHWLLRSAFKDTNAPEPKSTKPPEKATSPKAGK